jgi:hypothetical protein
MLLGLVVLGGLAFLIGTALGAAVGTSGTRMAVVLAAAPLAALAYFVVAYLGAPTEQRPGANCSDCGYTLGRYWEFGFFVVILGFNVVGWWVGALLGAGGRALYRRSDSARPSAT